MTFLSERVWVLTDGRPGHISQTLGLAERLTPLPVVKSLKLKAPYRQASPFLGWAGGRALTADSTPVAPPWPDLIITSGRSAIPVAFGIRRAQGGRTRIVNVQDPGWFRSRFDMIVVPEHDDLTGANIITTAGALGRVTPLILDGAAAKFATALSPLPRPRVAVLIGGANAVYETPPDITLRIAQALKGIAAGGAGLMVTFSRRSGPEMERVVRAALAGTGAAIWDGTGDNPYFAYLALADHILATEDSASMISEAAATGRPISILPLAGGSPKFARFHAGMRARGVTRPFTGRIDAWNYVPLDETGRIADAVRQLLRCGKGPL